MAQTATTTIGVLNTKGGSGKTTTAIGLAVAFATGGARTVVLDLDPQASAVGWAQRAEGDGRPLPIDVTQIEGDYGITERDRADYRHRIEQVGDGYDLMIIDTGPGNVGLIDAATQVAHDSGGLVVIPSAPTELDIPRTMQTVDDIVHGRGRPRVLLTQVRTGTLLAQQMRALLTADSKQLFKNEVPLRQSIAAAAGKPIEQGDDILAIYTAVATELLSHLS